ncbi:MAG: hypothetical protein H0X67_18985, partial [Acidobacteria bacterium]|nr:hypothetical protein [Acidobacteriota bacterium]
MTSTGALFLGLTAVVAALCGVLAFAIVKIMSAARAAKNANPLGAETAFMASAME